MNPLDQLSEKDMAILAQALVESAKALAAPLQAVADQLKSVDSLTVTIQIHRR